MALGVCYNLDTTNTPYAPPCLPGDAPASDGCHKVTPPCRPGDYVLNNLCFYFDIGTKGKPSTFRTTIFTGAKVVFITACRTTSVFTDWWNMELAQLPGGGALVVPDIDAMKLLPANQQNVPLEYQGFVDLEQGAVAYEAYVKAFGAGSSADQAKVSANKAVADFYPSLIYPQGQQLPQVVYKVIGNPSVCLNCVIKP
jgi:hypothetical protein